MTPNAFPWQGSRYRNCLLFLVTSLVSISSAYCSPARQAYNYESVCDFISARFYQASQIATSAPKENFSKLRDQMNGVDVYTLKSSGIDIMFMDSVEGRKVVRAEFPAISLPERDRQKSYLLRRLGAAPNSKATNVHFECDAEAVDIRSGKSEVTNVVVSSNFAD